MKSQGFLSGRGEIVDDRRKRLQRVNRALCISAAPPLAAGATTFARLWVLSSCGNGDYDSNGYNSVCRRQAAYKLHRRRRYHHPLNPPAKGRQNLLNLLNPGHPVAPRAIPQPSDQRSVKLQNLKNLRGQRPRQPSRQRRVHAFPPTGIYHRLTQMRHVLRFFAGGSE